MAANSMSVRELKMLLAKNKVDYSHCVEKKELIELANEVLENNDNNNDNVKEEEKSKKNEEDIMNVKKEAVMEEKKWSAKDIKTLLKKSNIKMVGCIEKNDFINLAIENDLIDSKYHQLTEKGKANIGSGFSVKMSQEQYSKLQSNNNNNNNNDYVPNNIGKNQLNLQSIIENEETRVMIENLFIQTLIPAMVSQLSNIDLGDINETVNAPKLGEIELNVKNLKILKVEYPTEKTKILFNDNKPIHLKSTDISIVLDRVDWGGKKLTFPKLSTSGKADIELKDAVLNVIIEIVNGEFVVSTCSVEIGDINVELSGTKAKLLYKILIATFKSKIKTMVEQMLSDMVNTTVTMALQSFSQMLAPQQ